MDTWIVSLLLMLSMALASSEGSASAVPFYRYPESEIPSGEMRLKDLKSDGTETHKAWVKVKWGEKPNQQGWVPRRSLVLDIDLSKKANTIGRAPYFYQPHASGDPVGHFPANTVLDLKGHQENWVKATIASPGHNSRPFWVEERFLKASPYEGGQMMVVMSTGVREQPQTESPVAFHLTEGSVFTPLQLKNSWALIKLKGKKGWINLHDVVSKAELADHVLYRGQWRPYLGRTGRWVALPKGVFIGLSEIAAINTNPQKAILQDKVLKVRNKPSLSQNPVVQTLGFGQRLAIIERQTIKWKHAYTSDYGSIWWSVPVDSEGRQIASHPPVPGHLTTDEVFSRGVFDMASNPQFPGIKYVSAQGIFKTEDDETWKKLEVFGNKNYPLALTSTGVLYVGPHLSRNGGATFTPYLRWDKIVARYMKSQGRVPQRLTLTGIDANEWTGDVTITLSSGLHQWKLRSSDSGLNWTPVADQTPSKATASRDRGTRASN